MTLPKGWENEKYYSAKECRDEVVKAITRVIYDCIATHEAHGLDHIMVGWLRDYCDDIAVNFPKMDATEWADMDRDK